MRVAVGSGALVGLRVAVGSRGVVRSGFAAGALVDPDQRLPVGVLSRPEGVESLPSTLSDLPAPALPVTDRLDEAALAKTSMALVKTSAPITMARASFRMEASISACDANLERRCVRIAPMWRDICWAEFHLSV